MGFITVSFQCCIIISLSLSLRIISHHITLSLTHSLSISTLSTPAFMADYSVFSNPEFSSTAWINSIINDSEDVSIEGVLSTVATKLHIMSQDYSDQLETSMVESMSTMPRLLSDISKIEDQLKSTENEMKKLSLEIVTFDQRNVAGVEDLSRLDLMKTNIERCKATLEEHARWSMLVREAKSQLESGSNRSQTAERYMLVIVVIIIVILIILDELAIVFTSVTFFKLDMFTLMLLHSDVYLCV